MNQQTNPMILNTAVTILDNAIITAGFYPSYQLSISDTYPIVQVVNDFNNQYFSLTIEILDLLYQKNISFAQAIDYFRYLALNNVNSVTCDNLEMIENPVLPQPIKELNALPLLIREYVMFFIRDQIKREYTIPFFLGEENKIISFDISPHTHLVATSSVCKTCCLWSLKTGELVYLLPENIRINTVQFNNNGTKLKLFMNSDTQNKQVIKIYNIDPIELESTITIQKNTHVKSIDPITEELRNNYIQKGNYLGQKTSNESVLHVTKFKCENLALCEEAINNTKHRRSLQKLWSLASYTELTPIEKGIVHRTFERRNRELSTIQIQ